MRSQKSPKQPIGYTMHDSNEPDILLVEASPADAELALRALRRAGIGNELIWIDNGGDALDFLFADSDRETRPAPELGLILLETRLAKVDGVEVLHRIKADARTSSIPVVMLSASVHPRLIAQCYQRGANSVLVKPMSPQRFAELVAEAGAYWTRMNRTPRRATEDQYPLPSA